MAGVDPDLLSSPYADPDERRSPWTRVIVPIALVLAAAALTTWLVMRSGDGNAVADGGPSGTTTTIDDATPVALTAFQPNPPLLTHPTLLPIGWKSCVLQEDRFKPDRFCGGGEDEWVSVSYTRAGSFSPESATPAGFHDGMWLSEDDPLELRIPVNEHVDLAIRTRGLTPQQAMDVAESIPLIGDRGILYGAPDIPIDWEAVSEDDVAHLLDQFESDATVQLERFELTISTSNAVLHGFNSRGYWTPVAATDLPMARLVEADRPLVVGATSELQKGYAVWDQAGYSWRLEGNLDVNEATALALSVVAKLAALPRDMSG